MMKKLINNIFAILLILSCLITLTYGWWISGSLGDGVVIKSAKISSIITVEKGNDFNYDGNLDKDSNGEAVYEEVEKTNKNTEQVLVLDFGSLIPTEIHTWRITVQNKGDVAGYVYATLFEDIDFTDGISKEEEFLKFMSISTKVDNGDGTFNVNKKFFYGLTSDTVLFGGTDKELVNIDESIQIEFQITFENFDILLENGICGEADRQAYQELQGKTLSESFKFLDVSLSSYQPDL